MHEAKKNLRMAIKERLTKMSAKDRDIESRVLCKELKRMLGDTPTTITLYLPFSDEPNIEPLITELLAAKWAIALPAIEHNALVFRNVTSIDEAKKNPETSLREPPMTAPVTKRESITYVIVPGRAFTRTGERLGRGNGGYDKWISDQRKINPHTKYIGVCFEYQVLPDLVTEPHDEKMDMVVTARGIFTH